MRKWLILPSLLIMLSACTYTNDNIEFGYKAIAERYFRGVWGCDLNVVDDLAADSIVISYPIFKQLFDTYSFRGRDEVKNFAAGFCSRWTGAKITIHDAVSEKDKVVLLWSFRARFVDPGSNQLGQTPVDQEQSWGGMTMYFFDSDGKIIAEVGEESDPGPAHRIDIHSRAFK